MSVARKVWVLSAAVLTASLAMAADSSTPQPAANSRQQAVINSIFYQEAKLVENMHKYTPLVETYIQNMKPDDELGEVPTSDKYFLGRLVLDKRGINDLSYDKKKAGMFSRVLDRLDSFYKMTYLPEGFMQLVFLSHGFTAQNYDLKYLRQEFLGDVRTLVFDVVSVSTCYSTRRDGFCNSRRLASQKVGQIHRRVRRRPVSCAGRSLPWNVSTRGAGRDSPGTGFGSRLLRRGC